MASYEPEPPPLVNDDHSPLLVATDPQCPVEEPPPPVRPRRVWLPVALFLTTCVTTFTAGALFLEHRDDALKTRLIDGGMYAAAVMTILLCHEMGHFLQAVRYRVRASLPYFIPAPLPFVGTMGAVIFMEPRQGDRKAVFDIGISGPIAGLVPTLLFLWLGLQRSHYQPFGPGEQFLLGTPMLIKFMASALLGPIPADHYLSYNPLAFAGWVGLLVTAINLVPIGQLDGGHILYGMFRQKAHVASTLLLVLAIAFSIRLWLPHWWPMLGLITFLGTRHPPTVDDTVPLGAWRYVLGFATLAFAILGFMPTPIDVFQP